MMKGEFVKKSVHSVDTGRSHATEPVSITAPEMHLLDRSRSDLQHLIYWMEHDPSLHAQAEKIENLKSLLLNIEGSIAGKAVGRHDTVGRYHRN